MQLANKIKNLSKKSKIITLILLSFTVIFIMIGIFIFNLINMAKELDKTSLKFTNEAIPAISTNWSVEELKNRTSSDFWKYSSEDEMKKLFSDADAKLGKLTTYIGADGEAHVLFINGKKEISANYIANAKFEKGIANINLYMVQEENEWKIHGYHVGIQE